VVILTTSHNIAERDELLAMGANDFYTKPHNTKELTSIITTVSEKWLAVFVQ